MQHYLFTNNLKRVFNKDYGDIRYSGSLNAFPSFRKLYQYSKRKLMIFIKNSCLFFITLSVSFLLKPVWRGS